MTCILCEKEKVETWWGSFCPNCRKIKNLGNVYGFERIYNILEKCCIRNEQQLEKKIEAQKTKKDQAQTDESYEKPKTRANSSKSI